MSDTLHGAPDLLGSSLQHGDTRGKLLTRSMLLGEEEGDSDEDCTGREETHQDSVRLQELGLGTVSNRDSNTKSDGGTDDLKGRTSDIKQIVELFVSQGSRYI
jgi:hypothetical protein